MYYYIPDFVRHVDVVPDYNSVMISQEIINFVTKLINQNNIEHVIFSYDTTYQIGDFYCSVLVMKVPCFVEEPVIPVSFVLHDRRFCEVHNMFFSYLRKLIPKLNSERCVDFIIDREKALLNALRTILPEANIVNC